LIRRFVTTRGLFPAAVVASIDALGRELAKRFPRTGAERMVADYERAKEEGRAT